MSLVPTRPPGASPRSAPSYAPLSLMGAPTWLPTRFFRAASLQSVPPCSPERPAPARPPAELSSRLSWVARCCAPRPLRRTLLSHPSAYSSSPPSIPLIAGNGSHRLSGWVPWVTRGRRSWPGYSAPNSPPDRSPPPKCRWWQRE